MRLRIIWRHRGVVRIEWVKKTGVFERSDPLRTKRNLGQQAFLLGTYDRINLAVSPLSVYRTGTSRACGKEQAKRERYYGFSPKGIHL
jgi:hypothetical protein